jgi:hypothetical protein
LAVGQEQGRRLELVRTVCIILDTPRLFLTSLGQKLNPSAQPS